MKLKIHRFSSFTKSWVRRPLRARRPWTTRHKSTNLLKACFAQILYPFSLSTALSPVSSLHQPHIESADITTFEIYILFYVFKVLSMLSSAAPPIPTKNVVVINKSVKSEIVRAKSCEANAFTHHCI